MPLNKVDHMNESGGGSGSSNLEDQGIMMTNRASAGHREPRMHTSLHAFHIDLHYEQ